MASEKREEGGEEQFERLGAVAESYRSKRESFYSQKKIRKGARRTQLRALLLPIFLLKKCIQNRLQKISFEAAASTTTCGWDALGHAGGSKSDAFFTSTARRILCLEGLKRAQAHQGKNLDFLYALCKAQVGGRPNWALIDEAITQYKLSSGLHTWGKAIENEKLHFSLTMYLHTLNWIERLSRPHFTLEKYAITGCRKN